MSINMTQKFSFETDDLGSFENVLKAIVPVLFKPNGKHVILHINEVTPSFWQDGKEYNFDHSVIANNVIAPASTYYGATLYKTVSEHKKLEHACKEACELNEKNRKPPTRKFICRLADYGNDFKPGMEFCKNYSDIVSKTMKIVKEANKEQFLKEFHKAEDPHFDGSVNAGYRMHWEPHSGWNYLYVSMIHVYYGK
jgi:hypothetical protein